MARKKKKNREDERGEREKKMRTFKPRSSVKLKKKNDFVTSIIISILTAMLLFGPISVIAVAVIAAIVNITRRFLYGPIVLE